MAVSVSIGKTDTVGRYVKVKTGYITFDSSYPTNGEPLSATDLGFSTEVSLVLFSTDGGYTFEYDYGNSKVKAYLPNSDAVAPSVGKEVANAVSLSTVTARFVAFGF